MTQFRKTFELRGHVEIFRDKGGWHFVRVPTDLSAITRGLEQRGLVAITARIGASSWQTSLLPKGDGRQFIAIPKRIRSNENVSLGDDVDISYTLRQR